MSSNPDLPNVPNIELHAHPALATSSSIALLDLSEYTFVGGESIWELTLPLPSSKQLALSSIGPIRTPPQNKQLRLAPYDRSSKFMAHAIPIIGPATTNDDAHGGEEDNEKDESGDNIPIPKPEGQAGRLQRDGYHIVEQVKWDEKTFAAIRVSRQT